MNIHVVLENPSIVDCDGKAIHLPTRVDSPSNLETCRGVS